MAEISKFKVRTLTSGHPVFSIQFISLYLFAKAATRYSGTWDDVSIMSDRCRNLARYLLNETLYYTLKYILEVA